MCINKKGILKIKKLYGNFKNSIKKKKKYMEKKK